MGFTKDLWTRPQKQPDGKIKRVPNARHGKGKRWLACWLDPDNNEKTKAFARKNDADDYWRDMESDRDRGDYLDPRAGEVAFSAVAERWFASNKVDPATAIRYESVYRLHVEPKFGKRLVKRIKPSDVSIFQTSLGETHGPSTVAAARLIIVGVLDLADADDMIRRNPATSPAVQKVSAGDTGGTVVAWSDERVYSIIDAHPPHLRAMPTVGATLGLREGEWFGLSEEDIDFDEKVVRVNRQIKKLGKHYVFALPKGDKTRIVPMSDFAAEQLRNHIKQYPPTPCSLPWEKPNGNLVTHRILFRWIDGGHLKSRAYSETCWKPSIATAGVIPPPKKDKRGRKRYETTGKEGTHQLRHYFASVLLADGVSIRELAEYLGHANPGFTLRVYSHMLPDSHDRARAAINRRMFRPRAVATEQGRNTTLDEDQAAEAQAAGTSP